VPNQTEGTPQSPSVVAETIKPSAVLTLTEMYVASGAFDDVFAAEQKAHQDLASTGLEVEPGTYHYMMLAGAGLRRWYKASEAETLSLLALAILLAVGEGR
jgi:hypothetical protein